MANKRTVKESELDVVIDGAYVILEDSVVKLDANEGDAIVVTMPESSETLPAGAWRRYAREIAKSFNRLYEDKEVKVVVVPHGTKVEMFKSELFTDKE